MKFTNINLTVVVPKIGEPGNRKLIPFPVNATLEIDEEELNRIRSKAKLYVRKNNYQDHNAILGLGVKL